MKIKRVILIIVIILAVSGSAWGVALGDILLTLPPISKVLIPLTLLPEMISDPDAIIPGAVAISFLSIPNSMLLINIYSGNSSGTQLWRNITKFTDAAMGLTVGGIGVWLLAGGGQASGGWDMVIGTLYLLMSLPIWGFFALDFIPYSFES
ncbi:MAG TPA: hypothetical protein ENI27_07120 [bacterium]|nr:hypothetical protein [bacterium]